jgi:hypothetical protein
MSVIKLINELIQDKAKMFQFNEDSLSGYEYEIPTDKEKLLYDFYMSTLLSPPPEIGPDASLSDPDLNFTIQYTKTKLYNVLQKELLDAVFFSLTAEIRHFFDANVFSHAQTILTPKEIKIFSKYTEKYTDFKTLGIEPTKRTKFNRRLIKDSDDEYLKSYKAALNADPEKRTLVEAMEKLFQSGEWKRSFGGKAWANIASAWLKLSDAKTNTEKMIWIDHVYDLQHNTDTVFNKIKKYTKDGSYSWLKRALDFKFKIKNPYDLFDKISHSMKTLSGAAIKQWKGTTLEQYLKDKKKTLNKKNITIPSEKENSSTDNKPIEENKFRKGDKVKIKDSVMVKDLSSIGIPPYDGKKIVNMDNSGEINANLSHEDFWYSIKFNDKRLNSNFSVPNKLWWFDKSLIEKIEGANKKEPTFKVGDIVKYIPINENHPPKFKKDDIVIITANDKQCKEISLNKNDAGHRVKIFKFSGYGNPKEIYAERIKHHGADAERIFKKDYIDNWYIVVDMDGVGKRVLPELFLGVFEGPGKGGPGKNSQNEKEISSMTEDLNNPNKNWKSWKNDDAWTKKEKASSGKNNAKKVIKRWNNLATGKTPDPNFSTKNREPLKQLKSEMTLEEYTEVLLQLSPNNINTLSEAIITKYEFTGDGKFLGKLKKQKKSNIAGKRVERGCQGSLSERKMGLKEQFRRTKKAFVGNLRSKVRGKHLLSKTKKKMNSKNNPFTK